MPKDFKVQHLSDELGQYVLVINCAEALTNVGRTQI
jgi:hypothetical protein